LFFSGLGFRRRLFAGFASSVYPICVAETACLSCVLYQRVWRRAGRCASPDGQEVRDKVACFSVVPGNKKAADSLADFNLPAAVGRQKRRLKNKEPQ